MIFGGKSSAAPISEPSTYEDKPMPNQQFTLIVEGADLRSRRVVDALFEAGCDDATVGSIDETHHIDFHREATSLGEAILSAVRDVEKVEGLQVSRVVDVGCEADSSTCFLTAAPAPSGPLAPRTDPNRLPLSVGPIRRLRIEEQAAESPPLVPAFNASLRVSRHHHAIPAALRTSLQARAESLFSVALRASA